MTMPLRVVVPDDEHAQIEEVRDVVCTLPPVPTGVISDATAKKMMRAMLDNGCVATTGAPAVHVIAVVVACATAVAIIAAIWGAAT